MLRSILLLGFSILTFSLWAQPSLPKALFFQSSYSYELPGGDLSDRFGPNHKFEGAIEHQWSNLWSIQLKSGFRIGDKVKEDVLAPLRTSEGFIIGVNGFYADIFGRKRGFDTGIGVSRLIPIVYSSSQSLFFRAGIGAHFISHWVHLVDDTRSVPQVTGLYQGLYDRLTTGAGFEQSAMLQMMLNGNRSGFLLGFQFAQSLTNERRSTFSAVQRLDLYFGFKITYTMSLYQFDQKETIYY